MEHDGYKDGTDLNEIGAVLGVKIINQGQKMLFQVTSNKLNHLISF